MDIHSIITSKKNTSFLSKIILFLFGTFLTLLIFAFSLKIFAETGIWIGVLVITILISLGFYYTEKQTISMIIIWGATTTLVLGTIALITGLYILTGILEQF
jgi:Na+/melibiose symporter-like transporter